MGPPQSQALYDGPTIGQIFRQYAAGPTLFFYLISPSGPMPALGPFHKVIPLPSPTMIPLVDARARETLKFDHPIKSLTGTRK